MFISLDVKFGQSSVLGPNGSYSRLCSRNINFVDQVEGYNVDISKNSLLKEHLVLTDVLNFFEVVVILA